MYSFEHLFLFEKRAVFLKFVLNNHVNNGENAMEICQESQSKVREFLMQCALVILKYYNEQVYLYY